MPPRTRPSTAPAAALGRLASAPLRLFARAAAASPIAAGLALGALASVAVGVSVAEALPDPTDTLPLSEVKPGMKGYGKTVFSGTEPEKFDIEIISVLKNFRPSQDLILIKTPNHPRLDAARTVGGMSGSPIYLKDKMIGAYAYGWLFGVEPIAGVTPIKSMLEDAAMPMPKQIMPGRGGPLAHDGPEKGGKPKRQFVGSAERYDILQHRTQLASIASAGLAAPTNTSLARASTPVMVGGAGTLGMKVAQDLLGPLGFEPVQAGGAGGGAPPKDAPTKFVDGGAIGVQLIRGDMSMMGLGTVTRVSGDKLVAFGHPMMQGGFSAFPTAIGKIHWIMASTQRSFKIGEAVRPLGTLINDRQASIVVDTSKNGPTFPVKVTVEGVTGAPKPVWNMEVIHDEFLTPAYLAFALGNALETTTNERGEVTWRATTKIKIAKYGTISVEDFGAGAGSSPAADTLFRSKVVRAVGALMNNSWEDVTLEGVEMTTKYTFDREVYVLRGTKLLDPEVEVGTPIRIQLELESFKGKKEKKVIEVKLPPDRTGEIEIEINPGWDVEKPLPTPTNVATLVAVLGSPSFDPESVVASYRSKDNGASFGDKVASHLPAGALDTLQPSTDSNGPETFSTYEHVVVPLKKYLVGKDRVRVKVKPVLR